MRKQFNNYYVVTILVAIVLILGSIIHYYQPWEYHEYDAPEISISIHNNNINETLLNITSVSSEESLDLVLNYFSITIQNSTNFYNILSTNFATIDITWTINNTYYSECKCNDISKKYLKDANRQNNSMNWTMMDDGEEIKLFFIDNDMNCLLSPSDNIIINSRENINIFEKYIIIIGWGADYIWISK